MDIEFEEFDSVEDIFLYMASITNPMKNVLPINSYKGYICSIIPLGQGGETFLMVYAKGSLENGILEFDVPTKSYKREVAICTKLVTFVTIMKHYGHIIKN